MVKIRLKRLGRKKRPFYRIVVMDVRDRREGAALAEIGFYNPLSKELRLDKAEAQNWIQKGAQATEAVARLLKQAPENAGEVIILEKAAKEKLSKKAQARKKEEEEKAKAEAEAKAAAAAAPAEEAPAAEEAAPVEETA